MRPTFSHVRKRLPALTVRRVLVIAPVLLIAGAALWYIVGPAGGASVRIKSPAQLHGYFSDQGYTMDALRAGHAEVPPLFMTSVPDNWAKDLDVGQKKSLFFRALLPLILQANQDIRDDRVRLAGLRERLAGGASLETNDRKWLFALAVSYGIVEPEKTDAGTALSSEQLATLSTRVDIIPPSVALAQGAIESAYALSRFAVEGNALFGQWRYGKGLKPEDQRTALGDYRIAIFKSPFDSVRSYARNLNSNPAYKDFRHLRLQARQSGNIPSGLSLVAGLLSYSERRAAYVEEVRALIVFNKLGATDTARLMDTPPIELRTGLF